MPTLEYYTSNYPRHRTKEHYIFLIQSFKSTVHKIFIAHLLYPKPGARCYGEYKAALPGSAHRLAILWGK